MKKTRKITLIAIFSVLVLGLLGVGGYLLYNNLTGSQTGNLAGVEWYSETEKEFTISTADELFELAKLSEYYDFKGQKVKLGADIVINEGNAKDWNLEAPARKWNPILQFAGTFDGQGHTISGMYAVGYMESVGMFAGTQRGCVIKNFKLVNSFFKNNGDMGTGSILAKGGGTIDTVYSDAIVVSTGWHSGGLVGTFTASGSNKITNCWFDGTLTMEMEYGRYAGGILGTVNALGGKNTIEHCLNSGTITTAATSNPCIGGICGVVMANGSLQLTDNLNVGMITTERGIYGIGSILGRVVGKTTMVTIEENYASSESYYTALGGSEGKVTGNSVRLRNVNLVGYEGYQWTELDFDKYWAVVMDDTPALQSFIDTIVDLDGIAKKIDTSWYVSTLKEFTLTTPAQLFGFAELSRTIDFKGVTIKLGADIVCNEGKASDWAKESPINIWKPIGYNAEFGGKTFLGTFDGQGHTISGLYGISTKSMVSFFGETGAGSVVKNLKITNSYFEAQIEKSSSWGMVGGVVAKSWGTVDTVYSNAILVNSGTVTGGIVGMMRITGKDGGECTVRNCWYDGQITANGSTGGIVGDIYGCPTTVEHCLNTSSISTINASGNIGGLVGIVEIQDAKLNLSDSVSVGKISDASKKSWNVGSAIGRVVKTEKVTNIVANIKNVYVSKEASGNAIGNKTGNFKGTDIVRLAEADLIGANGYFNTALSFYANGKGYWVAQEGKTPILKSFAKGKTLAVGGLRVDLSWYNKDADVYTIKDAAQLYGLRQLSESLDFKGKTIKLANDIVVNEGDASTWGEAAPTYSWRPIGYNEEFGGKTFQGTFDGQGYSISGLYGKTTKSMMALFGETGTNGVIKNLKVMNSYFEADKEKSDSWGMVAGVVAKSWGTVDTVYSNATLVNNGTITGGIVGMMRITGKVEGKCMVSNCWYDGVITANGSTGGIIGDVYGCEATIESCLFTGKINIMELVGNIGGLCGIVEKENGALNISDSLSTGIIKDLSKDPTGEGKTPWNVGSVLGRAVLTKKTPNLTEVTIDNVYAAKEVSGNAIGNAEINLKGDNIVRLYKAELTGELSYLKTQLSFYIANNSEAGKWVVSENSTPVLRSFAQAGGIDLTNVLCADISWYDEKKDTFEIDTVAELYGFAELSRTENFKDKTIVLKASLSLNDGTASEWKTKAPKYIWTPIQNFAGRFDGGMNTVSGLYLKSGETCLGMFKEVSGTVQNLILDNSYIENTAKSGTSATGSVVGRLTGTLSTVKSSADVVLNGSEYAGGLVGDITKAGAKVENSWFAGSVSGTGNHHGTLLGGVRTEGASATITNCLSTGQIDLRTNTGGLVGTLWNSAKLDMSESLFNGTFIKIEGVSAENYGAIVGNARNGVATIDKVYMIDGYISNVWTKLGNNTSKDKTGKEQKINDDSGIKELRLQESKNLDEITGEKAYLHMDVYFYMQGIHESAEWFAVSESCPVLSSFVDKTNAIDLTKTQGTRTFWYKPTDESDTFILYSAADFRGFQELSKTTNFAEKDKQDTVKLGADIDLNPGFDALKYSYIKQETATRPSKSNDWTPIGYSGNNKANTNTGTVASSIYPKFAGIFDGDMHSISGVFMLKWAQKDQGMGLFGEVEGATIKNFTLKNSYCYVSITENTKSYTGSVVGVLNNSTLDTVKCDKDVVVEIPNTTEYNGGMVGASKGTSTISNCWFAGRIAGKGSYQGGILGGLSTSGDKCTIENCLFTGNITLNRNTGGICGGVAGEAELTVINTLYAGKMSAGTGSNYKGLIVGNLASKGKITAENLYASKETFTKNIGWTDNDTEATANKTIDANVTQLAYKDFKGATGYLNIDLDYYVTKDHEDGTWVIVENEAPHLKVFGDAAGEQYIDIRTIGGQTNNVRTVWYKPTDDEDTFILYSPADFRGFQELSKTTNFAENGKQDTVKLGVDINLNPNFNAASYSKMDGTGTVASHLWEPIGYWSGSTSSKKFAGIFDGNMHTISGVCLIQEGGSHTLGLFGEVSGASIQNFTLSNSYFYVSSTAGKTYTGSIVGVLNGTLNTVKSDETVKVEIATAKEYNGGMVGVSTGSSLISNCWFAGKLSGLGVRQGGISGGMYTSGSICTVENCLVTGDIRVANHIGGIYGTAWTGTTLTLKNSLFAGTISKADGTVPSNSGMVIDDVNKITPTVSNVYSKKYEGQLLDKTVGVGGGKVPSGSIKEYTAEQLKGESAYDCMKLKFYPKDGTDAPWIAVTGSHPVLRIFVTEE